MGKRNGKSMSNRIKNSVNYYSDSYYKDIYNNMTCFYCGIETLFNKSGDICKGNNKTYDHIKPRCEGGSNMPDNLVVACFDCNNKRGNMPFRDFCKRMGIHVL